MKFVPRKILMIQMVMIRQLIKNLGSTLITAVCSHHKVSRPDEEEMNRSLKDLHWESDDNNSGKDGIDDGEDDFKELAQELIIGKKD